MKTRIIRTAATLFVLISGLSACQTAPDGATATQTQARPTSTQATAGAGDPLPSWNDGPTKKAITDFVTRVTKEGSPDFVAVPERIATFDNDGTLWLEKPLPNELYFVLARVKALADNDPTLRQRQPYKAALEGDAAYFQEAGAKAVVELLVATHSGMTREQFSETARQFLASAQHPALNRPFTATTYQPMQELLTYLRANGFQTWICSGGTVDFMRVFAAEVYGVPPERTIGSVIRRDSRMVDGRRVIWELPELDSINDKEVKPVNIDRQIGRRPLFAGGNVGNAGDIAMLDYSKGRTGPSFQLLINHDDGAREFAYGEKTNLSLEAAKKNGFTVANMKSDWKTIYATAGTR